MLFVTVGVRMFKQLQAVDTLALPSATSGEIMVRVYVGPLPVVVVDSTAVVVVEVAFEVVLGTGHLVIEGPL